MAIEALNNPFADFGRIVYGDRFIGRGKEFHSVRQRVLGKNYGNLAIVGLPRVGKSSLAWQAIMVGKDELKAQKTIPIFFETGHCSTSDDFFKQMVDSSYEEMECVSGNDNFRDLASRCVKSLKQNYEKNTVQRYFRIVKSIGYKTIFIIDEFDRARAIFEIADFQLLRELSTNPDTQLCLVTCSRKTIKDIEVRDGALSNFSGIFHTLRLKMFDDKDVDIYWEHFMKGHEPETAYKDWLAYHTGNHPYLMDLINYEVFDVHNGFPSNIDKAPSQNFNNIKLELMEALDNVIHTLEEEGLLNAALQLVIGPLYDVEQEQIEKLLKYGFIREISPEYKDQLFKMRIGPCWDGYAYLAFSDYSSLYLYRRYYADVPYFPVWTETENLLRSVVKEFLHSQFSTDWEKEFREYLINNPPYPKFQIEKWDKNLDDLKTNREKMVENFPNMGCGHLVDFTLTAQIFDIFIRPAKPWFSHHVFLDGWNEWNERFKFLTKIRNPIAHNNFPQNLEDDIRVAKEYCAKITQSIRKWQKRTAGNNK